LRGAAYGRGRFIPFRAEPNGLGAKALAALEGYVRCQTVGLKFCFRAMSRSGYSATFTTFREDAVMAVAGVDIAGPPTVAINYYGAVATLEGLRPLLVKLPAPRAVAVSSITSVYPFDQQVLNFMLDGSEEQALELSDIRRVASWPVFLIF
jgi:hypothetical protein